MNRCPGAHRVFDIPFTFIIVYRIDVVLICNVSVLQLTHVYIKSKTPWHTIHQFKIHLSLSSFFWSNPFKYPQLLYTPQDKDGTAEQTIVTRASLIDDNNTLLRITMFNIFSRNFLRNELIVCHSMYREDTYTPLKRDWIMISRKQPISSRQWLNHGMEYDVLWP